MEKLYTQSEVDLLIIQARLEERTRARDIAYEFRNMNNQSYESKKKAGNKHAFIKQDIAEECRYVGNAISGGNALSATLGETMEDRVREEYFAKKQETMKNIEIVEESQGLQCDNQKCDWTDVTIGVETMKDWINKPCPKCGENVLTEHDYNLARKMNDVIDFVNTLTVEQIDKISKNVDLNALFTDPNALEILKNAKEGDMINATVSMHKEVKIDIKKE
jgi:hypothetical protein